MRLRIVVNEFVRTGTLVRNARLITVVFRSAKERNFRGTKDDYATVIFRTMLSDFRSTPEAVQLLLVENLQWKSLGEFMVVNSRQFSQRGMEMLGADADPFFFVRRK